MVTVDDGGNRAEVSNVVRVYWKSVDTSDATSLSGGALAGVIIGVLALVAVL